MLSALIKFDSRITGDHIRQAEEMIADCMDWYPEAMFPIVHPGDDLALAAFEDGIWIAETHGEASMGKWTKLEMVTAKTWMSTEN